MGEAAHHNPGGAPDRFDVFSLGLCGLIWGTTWLVLKFQLGAANPIVSILYRFALAGLLMGMGAPQAKLIASVTFIAILMTILIQATTTRWLAEKLDLLVEE